VNGRRCSLWSGSRTACDEIWPILTRLIAQLEQRKIHFESQVVLFDRSTLLRKPYGNWPVG
jgi:hypothetical protein